MGATKVVCSRLTIVETRRVIGRAVAENELDEVSSTSVLEAFARATATWAMLELSREVAERAERAFPVEPVRTLDALYLARAVAATRPRTCGSSAPTSKCARTDAASAFEVLPA